MKSAKCTCCGANIQVDENKEIEVCKYCGNAFIVEKAIAKAVNETVNNANVINNYYGSKNDSQTSQKSIVYHAYVPPRPKINISWAIVGFIYGIIPGVIYVKIVKDKQKKWDEKYGV